MKSDELKKLISQIKKYNLEKVFNTTDEFDLWLKGLNDKQIKNLNSLDINPSQIQFPKYLLLNKNLLNCDDYSNRVEAMTNIKNADDCYQLFDKLCSPNFLNSDNYYKDMEAISRAPSARYPLWIINENAFINSPYHSEDLELIVGARDPENDKLPDHLVSKALSMVASDANSIKSPYHREDMRLIAHANKKCLQWNYSIPEHSLNTLAINKVSLNDHYHLRNMKMLAQNPVSKILLYKLMTDPNIVKGKYYRSEVNAMFSAKSLTKAIAMYYYIFNPDKSLMHMEYYFPSLFFEDIGSSMWLVRRDKSVKGRNNPNYLNNLKLLNQVDDKYVLFIESLISNEAFVNRQNYSDDLELLLSIQDKEVFADAYRFIYDNLSLGNNYNSDDLELISRTEDKDIRMLLRERSFLRNDIDSDYHDFDMEYISKLDLDSIDDKILESMQHYLLDFDGINHPEHIERLEKLLRGEYIEEEDVLLNYLDNLEKNLDTITTETEESHNPTALSKIKKLFKR